MLQSLVPSLKYFILKKPFFSSEIVNMSITGPNYSKNLSLFPDRNLEYSTELNLPESIWIF